MKAGSNLEIDVEYDALLREMFQSCDVMGRGELSTMDFTNLCAKLSLQEHVDILTHALYQAHSRKLLTYECFRNGLILFITGCDPTSEEYYNLTETGCTAARPEPSDDWNNNCDLDENLSVVSNINSNYKENSSVVETPSELPQVTPVRPQKRYGRRSKPDMDLLKDRQNIQSESSSVVASKPQQDKKSKTATSKYLTPGFTPNNNHRRSLNTTTPIILNPEVFVGDGDDDSWKKLDIGWNDYDQIHETSKKEESPTDVAHQTLEALWWSVIGDPGKFCMNKVQLCILMEQVGIPMLPESEQLEELFTFLRKDENGLVRFKDFADEMVSFICGQGEESDINTCTKAEIYQPTNNDKFDYQQQNNDSPQNYNQTSQSISPKLAQSDENEKFNYISTPTGLAQDLFGSEDEKNNISPVISSSPNVHKTSSMFSSPENVLTESSSLSSNISNSSNGSSLTVDTSDLCPSPVTVDPTSLAAVHRRRRRRAGTNSRQSRASNKTSTLPHHHPIRMRQLENLPLAYLANNNQRYVSVDTLKQYWEEAGLSNTNEILEALQISQHETSMSVEVLSEAFENELSENLGMKAAAALYKRGIYFYKELLEKQTMTRSDDGFDRSSVDNYKIDLDELKSQLEISNKTIEELKLENERLKNQVQLKTDEVVVLETKLSVSNLRCGDLSSECKLLNSRLSEISKTNETLTVENDSLKINLKVTSENNHRLEDENTQLKRQAESLQLDEMKKIRIEDLTKKLDELVSKQSRLQRENEALLDENKQNAQEILGKNNKIANLEETLEAAYSALEVFQRECHTQQKRAEDYFKLYQEESEKQNIQRTNMMFQLNKHRKQTSIQDSAHSNKENSKTLPSIDKKSQTHEILNKSVPRISTFKMFIPASPTNQTI